MANEGRPRTERAQLYQEQLHPIVERYIDEHRERLLEELITNTTASLVELINTRTKRPINTTSQLQNA